MIIDLDGRVAQQTLGFRFEMALLYAFRLHALQRRKGSETPYFGHLLGVASQVIEAGGDEDEAIAALLHDAVEDQGGESTREAVEELFGERVARIVDACSDDDPESGKRNAGNWCVRKTRYLEHLPSQPHEVLIVSLSDKLYNARAILSDFRRHGEQIWDWFNQPVEKQLWYYCGLVEAFRRAEHLGELKALMEELERVVNDLVHEAGIEPLAMGQAGDLGR